MLSRKEVIAALEREMPRLRKKNGVKRIGLFGSVLRDEANDESDIDILIEFNNMDEDPLLRIIDVEDRLRNLIDEKISVDSPETISGAARDNILATVKWVDMD